jgi:magnesium-transporting ATPase (P-type)
MIPADVRLISCKDLFLTQASLTGEAFPVEKFVAQEDAAGRSPLEGQRGFVPGKRRAELDSCNGYRHPPSARQRLTLQAGVR